MSFIFKHILLVAVYSATSNNNVNRPNYSNRLLLSLLFHLYLRSALDELPLANRIG